MRVAMFLLVSEEIADRAGIKDLRTRTTDGRYVLYEGDMKLVHILPQEYATGIQGLEVITEAQAQALIEQARAAEAMQGGAADETPQETQEESQTDDNETNEEEEVEDGTDEPSE